MRSPVRALGGDLGVRARSHGGTAYVGVPRMTEMPRSCAPSSTGCSQSRSNSPSSGSQVDHTDSPTRMTVKPGFRHQVEVAIQPVIRLVLRVIRDAIEHLFRQAGKAQVSLVIPVCHPAPPSRAANGFVPRIRSDVY